MEDLSQRRNETNFMYSRRIQQYNLDKEQEKHNRTVQMQTERVMNKKTDRTSLHHSNKSIFKDADVQSARDVMIRTQKIVEVKRLFNATVDDTPNDRLDVLIQELTKVEERLKEKMMKKRYSFNPNAMNKCI